MGDLGLYLAGAADWPPYDNIACLAPRQRLLPARHPRTARQQRGPLTSRDIPDTCAVPWASTGWTNNRNVSQMLEFLMMRGEAAVVEGVKGEWRGRPRRSGYFALPSS
jgi:uncharacterized protein